MRQLQPDTLIKNPLGRPVVSSVVIACSADELWAVVGRFEGFDAFIPALARISMTGSGVGSLRKKWFHDGNIVVEQLNSHDARTMHSIRSMKDTYRKMGCSFTVAFPVSSSMVTTLRSLLPSTHAVAAPVRGAATYRALGR